MEFEDVNYKKVPLLSSCENDQGTIKLAITILLYTLSPR